MELYPYEEHKVKRLKWKPTDRKHTSFHRCHSKTVELEEFFPRSVQ